MTKFPIAFEYAGQSYIAMICKMASGYPIFFEVCDVTPNDLQLPDFYAFSISAKGDMSFPDDSTKYPPQLGNVIWKSIVKVCEEEGISINS